MKTKAEIRQDLQYLIFYEYIIELLYPSTELQDTFSTEHIFSINAIESFFEVNERMVESQTIFKCLFHCLAHDINLVICGSVDRIDIHIQYLHHRQKL